MALSAAHCAASGVALSLRLCASIFQIQALREAVIEMEAFQATQEKQLLLELEESRAEERCLKASVHLLETEVSELRVRLQMSDDKALAWAIEYNTSELELRNAQAQVKKLRDQNQELQKELEESEQGTDSPVPPVAPSCLSSGDF